MKKFVFTLCAVFVLLQNAVARYQYAKNEDSIQTYVDQALHIMQARSVNTLKIDWTPIFVKVHEETASAKNFRETYPVIKKVLNTLGDQHSKFFSPEVVSDYRKGYRAIGLQFPKITFRITDQGYAYLSLPAFYSYNMSEWDEYVNTFHTALRNLDKRKPKGWIIDLTDNDGGMLAPMYAAVSPLLDQMNVIGWRDGFGRSNFFNMHGNWFVENKTRVHQFKIRKISLKYAERPIAILINSQTASSAEFTAIAFVGQKNVSIVGQRSNGLTSANQEHQLSDGAFLVLTEGVTIDRNGKTYDEVGAGLVPDVQVGHIEPVGKESDEKKEQANLFLDVAQQALSRKTHL